MRFLALGDSYTIGEGVAADDRWPEQVTRALRAEGLDVEAPHLIARTAWTTDELIDAIAQAPPAGTFELVSVMIGVNDQYRGRPVPEFLRGFGALLSLAKGFAAGDIGRIVAISIPDWGVTPFANGRDAAAIAREIDAYNTAARANAAEHGARWVDVTESSRVLTRSSGGVTSDGLHPAPGVHAAWAARVLPVARAILRG